MLYSGYFELDWSMEETFPFHFTLKDYILSLLGLLTSLVDIGLDVWTIVSFYQDGAHVYMGVMIFLLLFSSVLVQVFSWRWYSDSLDKLQTHVEKYLNKHDLLKVFHVMQLGVYLRSVINSSLLLSIVTCYQFFMILTSKCLVFTGMSDLWKSQHADFDSLIASRKAWQ